MKKEKLNHSIWMLANAIQELSHASDSEISVSWLKLAIEDIEEVLEALKEEMPF